MRVNGDDLLIVKKKKSLYMGKIAKWFLRLESNDFIKTLQVVWLLFKMIEGGINNKLLDHFSFSNIN